MMIYLVSLFLGIISLAGSNSLQNAGDDNTYWLVKSINATQVQITESNIQELIDPKTDKLVFIIHGWNSNKDEKWVNLLTDTFLTKFPNHNVIKVDWKDASTSTDYEVAAQKTASVGASMGNFISILSSKGISAEKILTVGHSLGAHVAGFAGKTTQLLKNPISRIIALDPASEDFEEKPCENRLCKSDCKFLTVIHTDAGRIGFASAIGNADFYPNNGLNQPGCGIFPTLTHECNHARSWRFFNEAVQYSDHFTSRKCANYETYITNPQLCGNIITHIGDLDSVEEGVFYLQTNDVPPYSIF